MNAYTCHNRYSIDREDMVRILTETESTSDPVYVSRTIIAERRTFRGVPAKRVDLAIDYMLLGSDIPECIVLEVGTKRGKFDGSERVRLTLRRWTHPDAPPWSRVRIEVVPATENAPEKLSLSTEVPCMSQDDWFMGWDRLRSDMQDYNPARLVWWHARNWYPFLVATAYDDVSALANSFSATHAAPPTLAEANRLASNALYRLARDLGWVKLTLAQQRRYEKTGQWHRTEDVGFVQRRSDYARDGVSDYSHDVACRRT